MDYETGIVGDKRGISFQMFQEHLEVRPELGSKSPPYIPSRSALRNFERQLIKAGLIEKVKRESTFDKLRYRLVLASTKSLRSNEERPMNDHGGATTENPQMARPEVEMNNEGTTTEERPTSVTSVNTLTVMRKGWSPSDVCLDQLYIAGIPKDFSMGLVNEFVGYWITSGKAKDWNTQFYSHAQYKWKTRHETRKSVSGQKDTFDLDARF